tara:strand:+ start:809 stop:1231 length:423 start_codon:yes stop_codon:yes gene_type:complete
MKNATLIKDYPAIAIYQRRLTNVAMYAGLGHAVMAVEIRFNELMYSDYLGAYSPWDIFNSAVRRNECPIAAMEHAKKNGHSIYTMSNHGTCLSATKQAKNEAVIIDLDVNYYYCGKLFKMVKQPNNNFGLVEIEQPIELK